MVSPSVLVIVPTYNEIENLARLASALLSLDLDIHLLIVDDNSPDGTGRLADDLSARDRRIHALHRPAKLGLGTAYRAGFDLALKGHYSHIITMDADFSHPPESLPSLLSQAEQYDVVIGSRYVPGGRVVGSSWSRRLISRIANLLATRVLSLQSHDCTAGFRCYRRQVLAMTAYQAIRSDGYSFLIDMLYLCQRAGFRIQEVPITFRDRALGRSKISHGEILAACLTLVRLRWPKDSHGNGPIWPKLESTPAAPTPPGDANWRDNA